MELSIRRRVLLRVSLIIVDGISIEGIMSWENRSGFQELQLKPGRWITGHFRLEGGVVAIQRMWPKFVVRLYWWNVDEQLPVSGLKLSSSHYDATSQENESHAQHVADKGKLLPGTEAEAQSS